MAKGKIVMPPKKNIGRTVQNIIKQGPKIQPTNTLAKGQNKSFTYHVQKSRIPSISQNQRGRVLNNDGKSLTR